MSGSAGGPEPPATKPGTADARETTTGNPIPVIEGSEDTSSYSVVALPDNSATVWIGWDKDELSPGSGFPLAAGAGLSNEFNDAIADLYFTVESDGDGVAYLTVG